MVLAKWHWYIQAVCCVHMHSQLCPTLSDYKDYSLPGVSVHEIFQARILEQVATSFCRDLPDPGIEPMYLASPVLTGGFFTIWVTGEAPVYSLSSVQLLNHVRLFATPWTAARQASLSITISRSLLNSCPLHWWCHPTISSSVVPFSSCLQSFPASGSFPVSWFFASGSQSIEVSASVLPMNIQDWFPLGWTGWTSL